MPQLVRVPVHVDDVNRAVAVNRNGWRQTALGDVIDGVRGPCVGFTVAGDVLEGHVEETRTRDGERLPTGGPSFTGRDADVGG